MIKPIVLNEYYLSPNEVKAIAETTLALYASNMLRKRNMISESERNHVLDECARHLTPTLTEGNTRGSRKRIYTANQMREALTRHLDRMVNEGFGDWLSGAWNKTVDKLEDWGMYKRGDSFGRNLARGFGFNPDEGLSLGNVLNGALTLGSLAAAPFSGGGSLAGGAALRAALATGGKAALKNIAGTHAMNIVGGLLGGSGEPSGNPGQSQYANTATNGRTPNYYYGGYKPYSSGYNPYGGYRGYRGMAPTARYPYARY